MGKLIFSMRCPFHSVLSCSGCNFAGRSHSMTFRFCVCHSGSLPRGEFSSGQAAIVIKKAKAEAQQVNADKAGTISSSAKSGGESEKRYLVDGSNAEDSHEGKKHRAEKNDANTRVISIASVNDAYWKLAPAERAVSDANLLPPPAVQARKLTKEQLRQVEFLCDAESVTAKAKERVHALVKRGRWTAEQYQNLTGSIHWLCQFADFLILATTIQSPDRILGAAIKLASGKGIILDEWQCHSFYSGRPVAFTHDFRTIHDDILSYINVMEKLYEEGEASKGWLDTYLKRMIEFQKHVEKTKKSDVKKPKESDVSDVTYL